MEKTSFVTITSKPEIKYLVAKKFIGKPVPRTAAYLAYEFEATEALFAARREYCLNALIPVLDFISASRDVDTAFYAYRNGGAI